MAIRWAAIATIKTVTVAFAVISICDLAGGYGLQPAQANAE